MGKKNKKEERYYANDAYSDDDEARDDGRGKRRRRSQERRTRGEARDGSAEREVDDKYGKSLEYDPTFNGPIKKRSCTDVICCILFIVFILGTGAVAFIAFTRGDPRRLIYPTDSQGHFCGTLSQTKDGRTVDLTDKKYLFFFDLLQCVLHKEQVISLGCDTPQICVSECPDSTWTFPITEAKKKLGVTDYLDDLKFCQYGFDPKNTSLNVWEMVTDGYCAPYTVPMSPLAGRCIPKIFGDAFNKILDLGKDADGNYNVTDPALNGSFPLTGTQNNTVSEGGLEEGTKLLGIFLSAKEFGEQVLRDVQHSWYFIVAGLCISAFVSFIWIILLRWIAGPMVWLTIFLFIALFAFGTGYCFWKYFDLKDLPNAEGWPSAITTDFSYYFTTYNTWLAFGIVAGVILAIVLLILLVLRTRIRIAIALIRESSKAIGHMMYTLLWPIIPFLLTLIVWGWWGIQATYLASIGKSVFSNSTSNTSYSLIDTIQDQIDQLPCNTTKDNAEGTVCRFLKYEDNTELLIPLQLYNLFMLFWLLCFVTALDQIVLAGAFASYFWAFKKPDDIPAFPVLSSLGRALGYHTGSLAFGSLIIAIVKFIRVILEYLDGKLKVSENPVAKFVFKCLKCCFWCLEKLLKFLNKNAYVLIAVYGYSFCGAARRAFKLLMRNIIRVVVVDKVTDFVLFLGKLVVIGGIAVAAFFFFDGRIPYLNTYTPNLNYFLVPVLVITLGTYVITTAFFSVYSMGVDTMFLCFLEDSERHDGSPEKPYFMSKSLRKIVGKKNKKPTESNRR